MDLPTKLIISLVKEMHKADRNLSEFANRLQKAKDIYWHSAGNIARLEAEHAAWVAVSTQAKAKLYELLDDAENNKKAWEP